MKPPEMDTTECHGTGTSLGDPIEIGAYKKARAPKERAEKSGRGDVSGAEAPETSSKQARLGVSGANRW